MRNNIRFYRKKANLTQSQLALLCNVSKNTISSIERYKYYPSLPLAFKLSEVLNVDINSLFFLNYF